MPFKYGKEYDKEPEYRPYEQPKCFPGTMLQSQVDRERRREARADYLAKLEFEDQMAARTMDFSVDLRNKYQIRSVIKTLERALQEAENEEVIINFDPLR